MVHRDIKPQNLILARQGKKHVVKILDFGLAKARREKTEDHGLTGTGQMMGTPDYIAPEQADDAASSDIRADIYSLGCTLYYLLTGAPPFKGKSLFEILQAHHSVQARPLNLERPEVPMELGAVVGKMMAKEPAKRYQKPIEVAQALAPFVKQQAAKATPSGSSPVLSVARPAEERPLAKAPKVAPAGAQVVATTAEKAPAPVEEKHPVAWETLTEGITTSTESRKSASSKKRPSPAPKVASKKMWLIVAGVATAVLLISLVGLWAGGVFKVTTKDGTIVLENVPPDAEVQVEGQTVTLTRNGEVVTVSALAEGPHRLKVVQGGKEIWSSDVTVKLGGDPVRLKMEPTPGKPAQGAGAAADEKGFVSLFNGKDLTGWHVELGDVSQWSVQGGAIVGTSPGGWGGRSYLLSTREYGDFTLRLQFMVDERSLGALAFRALEGERLPGRSNSGPGGEKTDGLNAEHPLLRLTDSVNQPLNEPSGTTDWVKNDKVFCPPSEVLKPPPGAWHTLELTVRGDTCTASIDGQSVIDLRLDAKYSGQVVPALKRAKGKIGFLARWRTVRFRRIEIMELPPAKAGDSKQSAILVLEGHQAPVRHLVFTPDGSRLISASNSNHDEVKGGKNVNEPGNDNTVRVWNVVSGEQIRKFLVNEGFGYGPHGIGLSPDGRFVAACTSWDWGRSYTQPRVFVWDIGTGTRKHHFALPGDRAMRDVGFSADGKMLYAVRSGKGLHSWSMPDGKEAGTIDLENQNPGEAPFATTFTSDCRYVLGGVWSGVVRLWDRETGKEVKSFEGHTKVPNGVAMSPDGTRILSCAGDFSVRMWETESGRQVFCLDNLDSNVLCVAFSPDGKKFLTGADDGAVRLRDSATGKEVIRFSGHAQKVNCVVFSAKGQIAASGSDDKTIRLWQLPKD